MKLENFRYETIHFLVLKIAAFVIETGKSVFINCLVLFTIGIFEVIELIVLDEKKLVIVWINLGKGYLSRKPAWYNAKSRL